MSLDYGTHGSVLDNLPRLPIGIGDLGFLRFAFPSVSLGGFPVTFGGFPGGFGGVIGPGQGIPSLPGPGSTIPTLPSPSSGGSVPIPQQAKFPEDDEVTDWGGVVTTLGGHLIGSIFGETGGSLVGGGPTFPQFTETTQTVEDTMMGENVTVNTKTGKITKCKRRRRRRLLTPTDLSDLAALKTIVGNTDALKFAVTKAVRR